MADPHHVPDLDGFDRLTVGLYRLGLVLSAAGTLWAAASLAQDLPRAAPSLLTAAGVALAAWNLHLYDKRIRWIIQGSAWVGLTVRLSADWLMPPTSRVVDLAGTGFLLATLGALAFKEWFCFRLPGLRATPFVLAAAVVALLLRLDDAAAALLALAGVLLTVLALGKLRMPLHVDVGDRDKYQI